MEFLRRLPFAPLSALTGALAVVVCAHAALAQQAPPALEQQNRPNRNRPGPWENDVIVQRVDKDGGVERLATFPRAGVATITRMKDDRLIAAHQHFPADNDADFDKVAVRFSSDEGRTWTEPQVIRLEGLPAGMRFPFDPTLLLLSDGRLRLYFTSLLGRRFEEHRPAIYSAISSDGLAFVFEPGVRFGIDGRRVIDCAVTLHRGVYHLFAPDNGDALPGAPEGAPARRRDTGRPGRGYHATSEDGLSFTRQPDLEIDSNRRWLGNAQSDGEIIRFFGTGRGVWIGTSPDGVSWTIDETFPAVGGADPGAVRLKSGGWLVVATGPPREPRQPRDLATPQTERRRASPFLSALDVNNNGIIEEEEIDNAPTALRKLDRNRDRKLTPDEFPITTPSSGAPPRQ